ncbi:hypothetical protein BAE44_0024570 [Dichanthelium oligosanthes]|uniref:Leucine-rich repeat-containing N-terminal plant-type domain-containing protein n=1 Tax=Dichanthelium oligosanthes TaxID=888268 RepID=A0A1E5UNH5_9POAL|nr:hypothetical protein BAE44_0024570 [Dichanthelium oligosanthes]
MGHGSDEAGLMAFKAKISGNSGMLSSWNKSTSYCSWEGITCGKRHWWRVVALELSSQGLTGTISPAVANKLSGEIPDTIGNCRVLEILLMDDNSFQGDIPATLKNMAGLALLNLTNNKLNGSIPGNLGSLTDKQELYLSHNNLSGLIPELLGNSASLLRLYLSFNNLQGDVPEAGVFRNLTGLSIVGNNALCGGIPQLHLPRC